MEDSRQAIDVVGLCGSLRPGSYTKKALAIALEGAAETGARTELLDLNDFDLVFCDGTKHEERYPEGVSALRAKVKIAQGIILATPEYHGAMSGVIKNAIDLMGFDEFEGKMIGLVGVSGGRMGALNALNSLRMIGRVLHAWVVPQQISIPEARKHFDESGRMKNEEMAERIRNVGRQVARFAFLHNSDEARLFLKEWESAPPNPGGKSE